MKRMIAYFKKEAVLSVVLPAAIATAFIVPPSAAYFSYLDYKVLTLLFCLMAVVAGAGREGAFETASQFLLRKVHGTKALSFLLVFLCFFSSMLVTNDVALIAFVPLAVSLERVLGRRRLVRIVVLQAVAANVGSVLTPVGNPQNLYLYSRFSLSPADFFAVTVPLTVMGFFLLLALLMLEKNETMVLPQTEKAKPGSKKKLCVYAGLFVLCLLSVFSMIPYYALLAVVCITVLLVDRSLFRAIDYGLLLTFVCFFVFVGNINQLDAVKNAASQILLSHEYACSVGLSQVISNVPTALLLSPFTDNWRALIAGTNVGGLGTPVASLASLIAMRLYMKSGDAKAGRFLLTFFIVNIICLVALGLGGMLILMPA